MKVVRISNTASLQVGDVNMCINIKYEYEYDKSSYEIIQTKTVNFGTKVNFINLGTLLLLFLSK
jgi:hypothetical protein